MPGAENKAQRSGPRETEEAVFPFFVSLRFIRSSSGDEGADQSPAGARLVPAREISWRHAISSARMRVYGAP